MKKATITAIVIAIALAILLIVAVKFIVHSTGNLSGPVQIHNQGEAVTISDAEAEAFYKLFSFRFYNYGIGGCPFHSGLSVTFGDQEFALAYDGCYCAKNLKNGHCIEFTRSEWLQIRELFSKYFGKTLID